MFAPIPYPHPDHSPGIEKGPDYATLTFTSSNRFLEEVTDAFFRRKLGVVYTHLDPNLFKDRLRAVSVVAGEIDGAFLPPAQKHFSSLVVEQDYALAEAGIRKIYCTSKPLSEITQLGKRLAEQGAIRKNGYMLNGKHESGYPAGFLFESGAYYGEIRSDGTIVREDFLVTPSLAYAMRILRCNFSISSGERLGWRDELSRKHGVQLEYAGDGTHSAVFSIDILTADRPDDFYDEKYGDRSQFKVTDINLCNRVFADLRQKISELHLPALTNLALRPVGIAGVEITYGSLNKAAALAQLYERMGWSTGEGIAVIGSRQNDQDLYTTLQSHFPKLLSCHTYWDPACIYLACLADCAVIGTAYAPAFVDLILNERRHTPKS